MNYTAEVTHMCPVAKGAYHGPAPIPEEGKWVQAKQISDISGFTHGIGWCAPQQGACKLTLNVKDGIIEEALVETIGCSGMTHSAAMASEILIGKTLLEALNTDLVCDAINTAMRELFLQIVYGRTQSAFSDRRERDHRLRVHQLGQDDGFHQGRHRTRRGPEEGHRPLWPVGRGRQVHRSPQGIREVHYGIV